MTVEAKLRDWLGRLANIKAYETGRRYTGASTTVSVFGPKLSYRKLVVLPPSGLLIAAEVYDRLGWTSLTRDIVRRWQEWTRGFWTQLFDYLFDASPVYVTYYDLLTLIFIPFFAAIFVNKVVEPNNSISWHFGNAQKLPFLQKSLALLFSVGCVLGLMLLFAWPHLEWKFASSEGRYRLMLRLIFVAVFVSLVFVTDAGRWISDRRQKRKWSSFPPRSFVIAPVLVVYCIWVMAFEPKLADMSGENFSLVSSFVARLSPFILLWCATRNWVIFRDILYFGLLIVFAGEVLDLIIPYQAT